MGLKGKSHKALRKEGFVFDVPGGGFACAMPRAAEWYLT